MLKICPYQQQIGWLQNGEIVHFWQRGYFVEYIFNYSLTKYAYKLQLIFFKQELFDNQVSLWSALLSKCLNFRDFEA